jgi:hypothetical protein
MRHRFHSMCPYFAMFPESFAETWIRELSKPGDVVLDPFAGRGTAPFQALLMDRVGVGADINPVAACVTRAKLRAPSLRAVLCRLDELRAGYSGRAWAPRARSLPPFFRHAFHVRTLPMLLYLRVALQWGNDEVDCFIAALVLGALHGEATSKRYLSNQMPRTISTKPNYSIAFWEERGLEPPPRDVFEVLGAAARFRFESQRPGRRGRAYFCDMRDVPQRWRGSAATLVVTSPPYFDLTSYEEDQWLRLWFLGGPTAPGKARVTRDDRRGHATAYWRLIGDFWRSTAAVLKPSGHVVVRIGATHIEPEVLIKNVVGSALQSPRKIQLLDTFVSDIPRRQTDAFRPGSAGCRREVDLHLVMR